MSDKQPPDPVPCAEQPPCFRDVIREHGFFYITDVLHMKLRTVSYLMRLLIRHALHLESLGLAGVELLLRGCSRAGLDHLSKRARAKLKEEGYKINQNEPQFPVALPLPQEHKSDLEALEASDIDEESKSTVLREVVQELKDQLPQTCNQALRLNTSH